jgi:RimJ/RimL family protein N-acetyltransferase
MTQRPSGVGLAAEIDREHVAWVFSERNSVSQQVPIVLRPATEADALPLLEWQRHPDTRRHARNPEVPIESEHLAWFASKISDPNCAFLIAEIADKRVGMIRLDRQREGWELSIIVAPEMQGRGIGVAMLATLDVSGRVYAQVLPGNQRSHRLFRRAGWMLGSDGYYHRPPVN